MFRLIPRIQAEKLGMRQQGRRGHKTQPVPEYPPGAMIPPELLPYLMEMNPGRVEGERVRGRTRCHPSPSSLESLWGKIQ